jgi:hypothetical protein
MKAVTIKPIKSCTEVTESKYIKEIMQAVTKKPSVKSIRRNYECLDLLRKARRG